MSLNISPEVERVEAIIGRHLTVPIEFIAVPKFAQQGPCLFKFVIRMPGLLRW